MSISKQTDTDGRKLKRRKLSSGGHDDYRFNESSTTSDSEESDIQDQSRALASTSGRSKTMRRSNSHPVLPTGGLNKSSVLTIQLNELLAASTPNYDARLRSIEPEVERIRSLIRDVPKTGALSLKDAERLAVGAGVSIPFPSPVPGKETNLKFEFDDPASLNIISALHLRVGVKGQQIVKVVVEMPSHLLQEKDCLNHRAFHKRAFCLARIAAHIQSVAANEFDLDYAFEDGVGLLPALVVTSTNAHERRNHTMMVTITFPEGAFAVKKLLPTKSCIRSKNDTNTQATPTYNSVLNSQACVQHYQNALQTTIKQCPGFADACRAGQIWLQQRGFDSSIDHGGFGFWEWATMSSLLLQTGGHKGHAIFSERYSSLQLFKAMLQVLSGRNMTDPWVLNASDLTAADSDFAILYDGNTGVNLLHKMTPWSYQTLRHHARISLDSVNSKQDGGFEAAFDLPVAEPTLQYDEVYSISLRPDNVTPSSRVAVLTKLYQVMKRGLGDRVTLLDLQTVPPRQWSITKHQPQLKHSMVVGLRLLVNAEAASRLIDHGPSADDQEAAQEFQRFWGEKSELRRFKDGSISESLVWSPSRPVVEQIVEWLLNRHLDKSAASPVCKSPKLESQILESGSSMTTAEALKLVNNQFQTLSSTLHQLEGLPLPIRSISPADPVLRSSTLHHPLLPTTVSPISILIQFDSSTRWPDSLPAIQHTKIAFLLKLADLLSTSDTSLTTRVGLENTSSQQSGYHNTSFLDIIYPPPHHQLAYIAFRLRIQHEQELPLLQAQVTKSISPAERSQATSALTSHKRTVAGPLHTTTLRTLTTRFSALSSTIRLLKAFISSHHLSSLIPPEFVELIAAHVFLHPSPWSVPGSASTAFLRCLHFLSMWDWQVTPIIIDLSLSQDMSDAAREESKTRFTAWRKLDPQMNNVSWFVGTSIDGTGVVWSEGGRVEKVVAARLRALASAVIELVKSKGTGMREGDWSSIFHGETGDFDFVTQLDKTLVKGPPKDKKKGMGKEQQKFKNLVLAQQSISIDDIGFDPVSLYLEDLRKVFGHVALFFHGEGQNFICGLWRPNVTGERDWRVRLGWSSVPIRYKEDVSVDDGEEKKAMCTINKDGILAEMGIMGEGIVKDIKVKGVA